MREENGKTPIVIYGISNNNKATKNEEYNKTKSITEWTKYTSMLIPLDASNYASQFVETNNEKNFHTSFLHSLNINSFTSPLRKNMEKKSEKFEENFKKNQTKKNFFSSPKISANFFVNSLVLNEKMKIISSNFNFPFPPYKMSPQKLFATRNLNFCFDFSFSSYHFKKNEKDSLIHHPRSQFFVSRGFDSPLQYSQLSSDFGIPQKVEKSISSLYESNDLPSMLNNFSKYNPPSTKTHV